MSAHQIVGPIGLRIGHRGALDLPPTCPAQSEFTHQSLHGAAGHFDALAAALQPHLACAVDRVVLSVHTGDLGFEFLITHLALGFWRRMQAS